MAFGNLGKVIAGQAIEATKKNVIDAITAEPQKPAEKPVAPETVAGLILAQIQGMQRVLKEDQELQVHYHTGTEMLRVHEVFVPSLLVLVLAGVDAHQNVTRAIVPADSIRLICKIVKLAPDVKPVRVNILSPRPKSEGA
ncbi:MAG: hypothetical protein KGN84_04465 [Acidobacteriota bacterium]|nr:hypothetical protein [Acidobacteriota bacterium]